MGDHGAVMLWLAAALVLFEALAFAGAATAARLKLPLSARALSLLASCPAPLGVLVFTPRLAHASPLWWLDLLSLAAGIAVGALCAVYMARWWQPVAGRQLRVFASSLAVANVLLGCALYVLQRMLGAAG
jgi:xanthine/uracil permease